jgi:hypothetical protein
MPNDSTLRLPPSPPRHLPTGSPLIIAEQSTPIARSSTYLNQVNSLPAEIIAPVYGLLCDGIALALRLEQPE